MHSYKAKSMESYFMLTEPQYKHQVLYTITPLSLLRSHLYLMDLDEQFLFLFCCVFTLNLAFLCHAIAHIYCDNQKVPQHIILLEHNILTEVSEGNHSEGSY